MISCSPTKRFTENEDKSNKSDTYNNADVESSGYETGSELAEIRVSMQGLVSSESLLIGSPVNLLGDKNKLALIKAGNKINCYSTDGKIRLEIDEQNFEDEIFFLTSTDSQNVIKLNGKKYRGKIQISVSDYSVDIINVLSLEDYVKGVLAKEMPLGKNDENLEALKAQAICIRTYAINKMKDGNILFDIYADTRDQVYGGVDAESIISNNAVDETGNLILKYEGNSATVFYHSTCGGFTESVKNVFGKEGIPYLKSVQDGDDPNCRISPRFEWKEKYSGELFVNRLKDRSLLDNQVYELEEISINSRFESGRVNELVITVVDEYGKNKSVVIRGNEIRSIIRNADGKSILWSTMFDVTLESNSVIIKGKGFGHGVGLCQWGAIALSREGKSYQEILDQYYPGTIVEKFNDKN